MFRFVFVYFFSHTKNTGNSTKLDVFWEGPESRHRFSTSKLELIIEELIGLE